MESQKQRLPKPLQVLVEAELKKNGSASVSTSIDNVSYIDTLFPDMESLKNLGKTVSKLQRKVVKMEHSIRNLNVQDDTFEGIDKFYEALKQSKSISTRLDDIQKKSAMTETSLQETSRGIRLLDICKKNIELSLNVVETLLEALSHLEKSESIIESSDFVSLLEEMQDLEIVFEKLEEYSGNSKIEVASLRWESLQKRARDKAFSFLTKNFYRAGNSDNAGLEEKGDSTQKNEDFNIRASSHILDIVGAQKLTKDWYCKVEMEDLRLSFNPRPIIDRGPEAAAKYLSDPDNLGGWISWLKTHLRQLNSRRKRLLPAHWRLDLQLCESFAAASKDNLSQLLSTGRSQLSATALMSGMKVFQDLELFLGTIFEPFSKEDAEFARMEAMYKSRLVLETENKIQSKTERNDSLRDLFEREREMKERSNKEEEIFLRFSKLKEEMKHSPRVRRERNPAPIPNFKGMISSVFDDYLEILAEEQQRLSTELQKTIKKEASFDIKRSSQQEGEEEMSRRRHFQSAIDVFIFVKRSIKDCMEFTRGRTLVSVFKVNRDFLVDYANLLMTKLPQPRGGTLTPKIGTGLKQSDYDPDIKVSLGNEDFEFLGVMVNSCEYCVNLTEQLRDKVIQVLEPITLQSQVDASEAVDAYTRVINRSLDITVAGIETLSEQSMTNMKKQAWNAVEVVGDRSPPSVEYSEVVQDKLGIISEYLSDDFYNLLLNTLMSRCSERIEAAIFTLKQAKEVDMQQVTVDIHSIWKMFENLPNERRETNKLYRVPRYYKNAVARKFGRIKNLVKVLSVPLDLKIATYTSLFEKPNLDEIGRILQINDISKKERSAYISDFKKMVED